MKGGGHRKGSGVRPPQPPAKGTPRDGCFPPAAPGAGKGWGGTRARCPRGFFYLFPPAGSGGALPGPTWFPLHPRRCLFLLILKRKRCGGGRTGQPRRDGTGQSRRSRPVGAMGRAPGGAAGPARGGAEPRSRGTGALEPRGPDSVPGNGLRPVGTRRRGSGAGALPPPLLPASGTIAETSVSVATEVPVSPTRGSTGPALAGSRRGDDLAVPAPTGLYRDSGRLGEARR